MIAPEILSPLLLAIALVADGSVIPAIPWYPQSPNHEHAQSVAIAPLPGNHFERIDSVAGGFACVLGSLGACATQPQGRISIGGDGAMLSQWSPVGPATWACVRSRRLGSANAQLGFDLMRVDFSKGEARAIANSKFPVLLSASLSGNVSTLTHDEADAATGWVEVRDALTLDTRSRTPIDLKARGPSPFLLLGTDKLIAIDATRDEVVQYELQQGTWRELRPLPVPVGWTLSGLCLLEKTPILEARVGDETVLGVIDTGNGVIKPLAMHWPDEYKPSIAKWYPNGAVESMLGSASRAAAIVDGLGAWMNVNTLALTCTCQWTCTKEPEIARAGTGANDTLLIVHGSERTLSRFSAKDRSWIEDLRSVPTGFGKDGIAAFVETRSGHVFLQREASDSAYTVRDPNNGQWKTITLPGDLVAEDASGGLICIQLGKLVRARSIEDLSKVDTLIDLPGFMISDAVATTDGLCCLVEPLVITKCMTDPSDAGKLPVAPSEPRMLFTDMTGRVRSTVELSREMGLRVLAAVGADCCVLSSPTTGWLVTPDGEKRAFEVGLSRGAGISGWYGWFGSANMHRLSLVDQCRARVWMVDVER